MADHDRGWELVQRRRKATRLKTDVWSDARWMKRNGEGVFYGDETTYFFTRFPDNFGAKEMFNAFAFYGRVMEVVIPAKRDKVGQRFGFARFTGVDDPKYFGIKLDNIIIGATKINVNAPRFDRANYGDSKFKQQTKREEIETVKRYGGSNQCFVWKEKRHELNDDAKKKSYAEAVRESTERKVVDEDTGVAGDSTRGAADLRKVYAVGKNKKRKRKRWGRIQRKEEFKGQLCFDVEEEEMKKFQRMYIGYVKQAGTTYSVQEWFSRQGVFSIKATPLGANSVLLEDIEEGTLDAMMTDTLEWLFEKFEAVKLWQPYVVDNERLVWLRCHGIPPHAWGEGICKLLANTMGAYVDIDEDTRKKRTFDIARLLIRTRGLYVINTTMHFTINGSVFPIRVMEEWRGPLRLVSTSKGADGVIDDDGESTESEFSESEYEMEPPLFSPKKMTEPASPVEEEGDAGRGCNYDHGRGETSPNIEVDENEIVTGVVKCAQVQRSNSEEASHIGLVAARVGFDVSGGCKNIQEVEETNLELNNTHLEPEESASVGREDETMGNEITTLTVIPCSMEGLKERKRTRKMELKTCIPMKTMVLNNSLNTIRSKASSSSSSRGSSVAMGVIRNGVGEYLPSLSNSIQSVGLQSQGICGWSIGDSEIRRGNDRAWVDHQIDTATECEITPGGCWKGK